MRPVSYREFQATNPHKQLISFKIGDDTFEAVPAAPATVMLAFAAASSQPGANGVTAIEASLKFLDAVLTDASAQLFARRLSDKYDPIEMKTVGEITRWLMEEYNGRPTEQPSPSSAGPSTTLPSSTAPSPEMAPTS
jgi:hypothetical protein